MKFFDAHCDTVLKVQDGSLNFQKEEGAAQVTLPGMLAAGCCGQVFACFVLSEQYPGRERQTAEEMIRIIHDMVSASEGRMKVALTSTDLRAACTSGPIAALIGLEGADPLEGNAESLHDFYRLGVRDLILAWKDNPFSGTAFGENTPVTPEGEKLIGLAEELGVMIDVSHLSDAAFDDVCRITRHPFIASHSNCRAVCPDRRNLTDDMIRMLASRGGVMGINLSSGFLDPEFQRTEHVLWQEFLASDGKIEKREKVYHSKIILLQRPEMEWITRHVLHAVKVGGEDCVGLGGDLDGTDSVPMDIDGIADYPKIAELLLHAGLATKQVEKICYQNLERVFCEVLPS